MCELMQIPHDEDSGLWMYYTSGTGGIFQIASFLITKGEEKKPTEVKMRFKQQLALSSLN